jgi:hypothetical protein
LIGKHHSAKFEGRYSLYPISFSQFSIGKTELNREFIVVSLETPDGPENDQLVGP